MLSQVDSVIIIPSYNETLALPSLLRELAKHLTTGHAVVVMDDSNKSISDSIRDECTSVMNNADCNFVFDSSEKKSGRGAAIRRGMKMALELYPRAKFIIECDADGSHRVEDILKLMQSENTADLIIGSRYLDESQIIGWPVSRRIFSFCLNILIPKLVHVPVQDITNGLRRYTTDTTRKILENPQRNLGFIYLSEQAIIVERSGLSISEIPITFIDRTLGKSTVTWREIYGSIVGITQLVTIKSTIKK